MKPFLLFLSALFIATTAIAHTINWYVDGSVYHTTTCESGENIILPTQPEKYGYTFQGWKKNYIRGIFEGWEDVPSNVSAYRADTDDNRVPLEGDYIIVNDTSLYYAPILIAYNGATHTFNLEIEGEKYKGISISNIAGTWGLKKQITIRTWGGGWLEFYPGLDQYISKKEGGTPENKGALLGGNSMKDSDWTLSCYVVVQSHAGKWQFFYEGVWSEHGKNGWKPRLQITNE